MSSQAVINWTRHQISQKVPLSQICEDMMSRCLSPDSDVAGGIGCDNMTVLIVALLGDRTLDEWYTWVAERVENKVGYDTPRTYEPLYPPPRSSGLGGGFGRQMGGLGGLGGMVDSGGNSNDPPSFLSPSWLQRLNRPLYLSQAGISSILPVGSSGSFDDSGDEFEDYDSDEEMANAGNGGAGGGGGGEDGAGTGPGGATLGGERSSDSATAAPATTAGGGDNNSSSSSSLHAPPARDSTSSLRAQLEAMDREDDDLSNSDGGGAEHEHQQDHDMQVEEPEDEEEEVYHPLNPRPPKIIGTPLVPSPQALAELGATGTRSRSSSNSNTAKGQEAPPPPRPATEAEQAPITQASAAPGGDAPSDAVKMEGLMDGSEAPTKM